MAFGELLAIVVGFITIVWFFWDINRRNGKLHQQALEIQGKALEIHSRALEIHNEALVIQGRSLEILQGIAHILDNQTKILAKIEENTRK